MKPSGHLCALPPVVHIRSSMDPLISPEHACITKTPAICLPEIAVTLRLCMVFRERQQLAAEVLFLRSSLSQLEPLKDRLAKHTAADSSQLESPKASSAASCKQLGCAFACSLSMLVLVLLTSPPNCASASA